MDPRIATPPTADARTGPAVSGRGAQYNFGPATTLREGCLVYGAARPGHVLPSREQASTPRGPDVGDPTVAEWARFMQVCSRSTVCVCVCVCVRARVCVWLRPRSRCFGVSVLCGCTCCVISCRSLNVSVPQCSWRTYRSFQPCLLCGPRFNRPTSRGERTFAPIYTALHVTKHMSPFQPPCLNLPPRRRKASSASCA